MTLSHSLPRPHFDLPRAGRALSALMRDPDDLPQVFELIESISGTAPHRLLRRFRRTDAGRRILRDEPDIVPILADRAALRELPEGSLGRAYLAFVESEGISPEGIRDASMRNQERHVPEAFAYLHTRMRDTHDLWHAATGYKGDVRGELALLAFTLAQNWNTGVALIVGTAIVKGLGGGATGMIRDGYRRGRAAAWMPAQDWESLLALPLREVRQRLSFPRRARRVRPVAHERASRAGRALAQTRAAKAQSPYLFARDAGGGRPNRPTRCPSTLGRLLATRREAGVCWRPHFRAVRHGFWRTLNAHVHPRRVHHSGNGSLRDCRVRQQPKRDPAHGPDRDLPGRTRLATGLPPDPNNPGGSNPPAGYPPGTYPPGYATAAPQPYPAPTYAPRACAGPRLSPAARVHGAAGSDVRAAACAGPRPRARAHWHDGDPGSARTAVSKRRHLRLSSLQHGRGQVRVPLPDRGGLCLAQPVRDGCLRPQRRDVEAG